MDLPQVRKRLAVADFRPTMPMPRIASCRVALTDLPTFVVSRKLDE